MTAATLPAELALLPRTHRQVRKASEVAVLSVRNLIHISREPFQLSDVTIQPVLFTVLFVYVFGAGALDRAGGRGAAKVHLAPR